MKQVPTTSQTVGPFFSIGLSALCREKIECGGSTGSRVTIHGRVFDGDGEPVPDALVEVWQASDEERASKNFPEGFARISTNERGEFQFTTTKPSARREEDGTVHAPHVVVVLFMRGLLRQLLTRIYFAGEEENAQDAVLSLVPAERRPTMLATPSEKSESDLLWDIRLQGDRETVFFET